MDGVRGNLGWRSSWWMVLWAGAILHCSFHLAQADENLVIEVDPPNPKETFDVLLKPPAPPADTIFCTWTRQKMGADPEQIAMLLLTQGVNQPGPGYTGRETINPDCSLLIKALSLSDTGIYELTEAGSKIFSGNINLEVMEIVPKPNVLISPSFVLERQSTKLRCNTTITERVSWLKDGVPLHEGYNLTDFNRTLYIPSVSRGDTGQYQCQVSKGNATSTSEPESLRVFYGPEVPVISPNNPCNKEHQNIILTCQAASYPKPQYTWFFNGNMVDYGPKLFIENFTESQAGIYNCDALNEVLETTTRSNDQPIHLEKSCVHDVVITGSLEGIEDQLTSLNCTAEGDDISYSWYKGQQPVTLDKRVRLINNNQTLVFDPCNRNDAAQYSCLASNSYSSGHSNSLLLDIVYGPDPPFINETVDFNLPKISLSCVAVSNPPAYILWHYNGLPVMDNPKVIVLDIIPENSGNYTCLASNTISGLQRETTLEIDMIGRLRSLNRR